MNGGGSFHFLHFALGELKDRKFVPSVFFSFFFKLILEVHPVRVLSIEQVCIILNEMLPTKKILGEFFDSRLRFRRATIWVFHFVLFL